MGPKSRVTITADKVAISMAAVAKSECIYVYWWKLKLLSIDRAYVYVVQNEDL